MSNIIVNRLISGEEILAETEDSANSVKLTNPCVVHFAPPAQGEHDARLALMPLLPYAEDKSIEINKNFVVFQFKPVVDIVNRYNKIFGSGLILPDSKIQTP